VELVDTTDLWSGAERCGAHSWVK